MRSGGSAPVEIEIRHAEQPGQPEILRQHDAEVQQRAERRDHHPAAAELHAARGRDRQHVQRGEIAGDAAGDGDEARDDQRVARELDVDDPSVALGPFQRERPEDVQRVGDADEEEQRLAGEGPRRGELDEDGRAEQQRADRRRESRSARRVCDEGRAPPRLLPTPAARSGRRSAGTSR